MGDYNPHSPQDLGNEWCPIREEDLIFSPAVNAFEIGHQFTLDTSRILQDARVYANDIPYAEFMNQPLSASIYPLGYEDLSGPVQRVIIPCNNGTITGATLSGAASIQNCLFSPADNQSIVFGSAGDSVQLYFAVNAYTTHLTGKRILGVNFLYSLDPGDSGIPFDIFDDVMPLVIHKTNINIGGSAFFGYLDGNQSAAVKRKQLGDINHFWTSTAPELTAERAPYIYSELQRFERSATNPLSIWITLANSISPQAMELDYAALEVIYCEEQRVATGIRLFGGNPIAGLTMATAYTYGVNRIPLRTMAMAANPTLTPGAYTTVLSTANPGDLIGNVGDFGPVSDFPYPLLNALRSLYSIPPHPGVQVTLPFPVTDAIVGREFSQQQTHILPQLSLHTSGGVLTEVHVYGRQAAAPVYGNIVARQGIVNSATVNTPYPQARFYARRFGDTIAPLVFRNQATPTITANITVAQFDALPEIMDGWKEVTLTFAAPTPSFTSGGAVTTYEWLSSGENIGSRWEILGAIAPAYEAVPGNLLALSPQQLSTATYGADTAALTWLSPLVSVSTLDATSDATLIFAQDMPTISGFALSALSQPVSGIGIDCAVPAGCIPSGIGYHQLTWVPASGTAGDTYTRTSVASFGTADTGQPYTTNGTAANFSVNGTQGVILPSTTSSDRTAVINVGGGADHDVSVDIMAPTLISASSLLAGAVSRYVDASNFYWADLDMNTTGNITVRIKKKVAGVTTTVAAVTAPLPPAVAGTVYRLRTQAGGSALRAKVWPVTLPEPSTWLIDITDTSLATGANVGVYASNASATLTLSAVFDNLYVQPIGFGTFEIQRMDTITDWQTIMSASAASVTWFNDYEARVGVLTSYRARLCDTYGFCGPWSATITGTLPAPGVFGVGDANGVLIFTSNDRYAGEINLAYTQNWASTIEEDFEFPEADQVRLQRMYNRDFAVAFRPLERGGETFTRTILIQAASVAAPVLENVFRSLRDMAWDTVPYICVRNELGDRWFATVTVPDGIVKRNRRMQLARVQVVETTDTAFPVDPAE